MTIINRLFCLLLGIGIVMAGCTNSRLHSEGVNGVEAGRYEEGVGKLQEAVHADPGNLTYRLDLKGRREEAIQVLIAAGDKARHEGNLDAAQEAYRRVLSIESGNARAKSGLEQLEADRRHAQLIEQARKDIKQGHFDEAEAALRRVLSEDPGATSANALRAQIDAARGPRKVTPHLRAKDNRPVTLQFRDANTKMVFEVLSRQTGINFVFDKDVKADGKTTIFVQNVAVDQAIALILGQNQLGQQVLAENMVLIYPNNGAKQKEYQDNIVRTFYLTNADPKKVMESIKTVLGSKTVFIDERINVLMMRDTPEAVRMAERMIASLDVPEAEVMLEVEVLELTRTRLQQLGIKYPTSVTLAPTPLAGDPLVLRDIRDQDDTTITVSNLPVTIDLKKSVGTTNVLASPRIRARNKEKAKILIGQRVPVITNSVTPTNTEPVVTGSVQYLDVGLTLEVEPTVYLDGDVAIKVGMEVSSIISQVTAGTSGTLAYQIGTRNANTVLRLKDGETQVLAGLINDSDRKTSDRIPGLGDMPILGRLFGSQNTNRERSEIVLSITPRIVRAQPRASSDDMEFWYGTETQLRSAPLAGGTVASSATVGARPTAPETVAPLDNPGVQSPAAAPPAGNASGDGTGGAPAVMSIDAAADAASAQSAKKEKPGDGASQRPILRFDAEPTVAVGQELTVTLNIDNATDVSGLKSMLRFDPSVLQFVGGGAGDLVPESQRPMGKPQADSGGGRVRFEMAATQISGSGPLVTLKFRALAPRPQTMIALQQFSASKGAESISVMAPRPVVVAVTP